MNGFDKNLILVLSLVLNGVLIAVLIVGIWAQEDDPHEQLRPAWGNFYHEILEVTEEQWATLQPAINEFRSERRQQCREVAESRRTLLDRIQQREPLDDVLERVLEGQRQMQQIVIEHIEDQRDTLTREQQRKYFDRLRRHTSC